MLFLMLTNKSLFESFFTKYYVRSWEQEVPPLNPNYLLVGESHFRKSTLVQCLKSSLVIFQNHVQNGVLTKVSSVLSSFNNSFAHLNIGIQRINLKSSNQVKHSLKLLPPCSFQKLPSHSVEICRFYCHSDFT